MPQSGRSAKRSRKPNEVKRVRWKELQNTDLVDPDTKYEELPRGRVGYDTRAKGLCLTFSREDWVWEILEGATRLLRESDVAATSQCQGHG